MNTIAYKTKNVNGVNIFYRESGRAGLPKLLLLHGFPTSSHMFRDLIPLLSDSFHIIAPDLPGFGRSDMPPRSEFKYTFENLSDVMAQFTEQVGFENFAMYIFDYGAPVGLRMALKHPERINAIISQNGNAYLEGLSTGWEPIQNYWRNPTPENRNALRGFLKPETTLWQYAQGVADATTLSPDGYTLDIHYMKREGAEEVQLDLLNEYQSNVALYPKFQEYFREHRPRLLAVWGKNDPFFLPAGAQAFKRDLPEAEIEFFETGHFALETHAVAIAKRILSFQSQRSQ